MPKGPHETWRPEKDGPKMRDGHYSPNHGSPSVMQPLYFPDNHPTMPGWFKGMEQILRERNLWRDGLRAECGTSFKCRNSDKTDCCCRKILYCQDDFMKQKSRLEEIIESRGHICDFYPKFHCELNFIEQYWGAAKLRYRASARTKGLEAMEKNMKACLDDVPLLQIRRYVPLILMYSNGTHVRLFYSYANRSARFVDAYAHGLDGAEAVWAANKYHGHRKLPPFFRDAVHQP